MVVVVVLEVVELVVVVGAVNPPQPTTTAQTMTRTAGLTTDLTMFLKRSLSKAMQHPCCP